MMSNTVETYDEGHLLELSSGKQEIWLRYMFSIIGTFTGIFYYCLLGVDWVPSAFSLRQNFCRRYLYHILVHALLTFLIVIGGVRLHRAIRNTTINDIFTTEEDFWWIFIGSLLFGMSVEFFLSFIKYFFQRIHNDTTNSSSLSTSGTTTTSQFPWRFSCFLLQLGSLCFCRYFDTHLNRSTRQYEYLGPMRISKMPTLSLMDKIYNEDILEIFPCLMKNKKGEWKRKKSSFSTYIEPIIQPNIVANLEISWGKAWGCRDNIEKWNTNWPTYVPCTKLICREEEDDSNSIDSSSCPCYPDESSARNASWECIESAFNLTLLREGESFDTNQPPWEDPLWPTITRYGSCDGNVGFTSEVTYIDNKYISANIFRNFGYIYFGTWFLLCIVYKAKSSRSKLLRRTSSSSNNNSKEGNLWKQLFQLRRNLPKGETIFIGEMVSVENNNNNNNSVENVNQYEA